MRRARRKEDNDNSINYHRKERRLKKYFRANNVLDRLEKNIRKTKPLI